MCVSESDFCSFSWVSSFSLLVLFYSDLLFYLIIFILLLAFRYPYTCLFSNKGLNGCGSGWEMRWEGTGESRERGKYSMNILHEENLFLIKGKSDYLQSTCISYNLFIMNSSCWDLYRVIILFFLKVY